LRCGQRGRKESIPKRNGPFNGVWKEREREGKKLRERATILGFQRKRLNEVEINKNTLEKKLIPQTF